MLAEMPALTEPDALQAYRITGRTAGKRTKRSPGTYPTHAEPDSPFSLKTIQAMGWRSRDAEK